MFKKTDPPRMELNCINCNKNQMIKEPENVQWSAVECDVGCKIDKNGNSLTAKFGCAPVYDANNTVVGARYTFDPAGFQRYQEICGGGCATDDIRPYLGTDFTSKVNKKCSIMDVHHPGSYTSRQVCEFSCPNHYENSVTEKAANKLHCVCSTQDDKRSCEWKMKKVIYRNFEHRNAWKVCRRFN